MPRKKPHRFLLPAQASTVAPAFTLPLWKVYNGQYSILLDGPSFEGAFPPDSRTVSANGFSGSWQVVLQASTATTPTGRRRTSYQQPFPSPALSIRRVPSATTRFSPAAYRHEDHALRQIRRLFVLITFLLFHRSAQPARLHHSVHPGWRGLSYYSTSCCFPSPNISNFDTVYLIACVVSYLITGYCLLHPQNRRLTWMMFGILALLYGFFYSCFQLQDYALLLGNLGLLLILVPLCTLTRILIGMG